MMQDLRFALRGLAKAPGFALVAVLSLALGIGGNTAIFTLVKAVFLRSLPVADPARLVSVFTIDPKSGQFPNSYPNFRDYRDRSTVFSGIFADAFMAVSLTSGAGDPEQLGGEMVSGNYFSVAGVTPALGRTFLPEDDQVPDRNAVAVLSHSLWERRFASNPSIVGQNIMLNAHAFTVIGVAPKGFQGTFFFSDTQLWVPTMMHRVVFPYESLFEERHSGLFNITARLKPGVSLGAADAQMQSIARQLAREYPVANGGRTTRLLSLPEAVFPPAQRLLFTRVSAVLMTTVGVVLLIACANIANLLLVRASSRRKEVAIRASLGASRGRMIRQLLTESLLLALAGGLAGLLVGMWAKDVLWSFRPPFLQQVSFDLRLDPAIVAFTAGLSLVTGILFGLAPALQMSRPDLATELKERTNQNARGGRFGMREVLVITQVALSLIALVGAGMFYASLRHAQGIDPGFDAAHMLVMAVSPSRQGYSDARARDYLAQVRERIAALPGVKAASFADSPPMSGGLARSVFIEGNEYAPGSNGIYVPVKPVSPGYFDSTGIPLLRGRDFRDADRDGAPLVAIINETMAARFWPNQDALGKRFKFFGQEYREVIGIAKNSKYFNLSEDPRNVAYVSLAQNGAPGVTLHVRTSGDPAAMLGVVRREVQSFDRNMPVTQIRTVEDVLLQALWAPRVGAGLLSVFALLALILASVGLYGIMSYSVSQRTGEIGVRMALGARPADLMRMLLRQVMLLAAPGVAAGILIGMALARSITSLLYGVSAFDPLILTATAAAVLAVALLASVFPARRAMQVDPIIALRQE